MKKLRWTIVIFLMTLFSLQTVQAYDYFIDILGHWSEPYVEWATNEVELFSGYEDGTFKPDKEITTAEYILILNKLVGIRKIHTVKPEASFSLDYKDLSDDFWAYQDIYEFAHYIESESKGEISIKSIFPGDRLNPNKPINRYDAAVLASFIIPSPVKASGKQLKDIEAGMEFYQQVMKLVDSNIINGYEDNTFRPLKGITRGEAATIVKKIDDELISMKTNYLFYQPVEKLNNIKRQPLFEYDGGNSSQPELDEKLINAITTLEYMSFVGTIPYQERHLYDESPINSLWELKNANYYNVIANNYYLLLYDQNLMQERKVELVKEGIEHYKTTGKNKSIMGMYEFFKISNGIVDQQLLLPVMENYFLLEKIEEERLIVGLFLAEVYESKGQVKQALNIYEKILNMKTDIKTQKQMAMNYGYLLYKNNQINEGINHLQKAWDELSKASRDQQFKKEIDDSFSGMIRQLSMKNHK